ncbi:MAG TPA: AAA family ATPase [Polyangia bacterium]|nr:AAA family ATPase [Polyangia bacterium]
MSSAGAGATGTFVGRERELAGLQAILEGAAGGRGGLAVLVGEPGIGKSRLAEEAAGRAAALGFRVGRGRAWESGAPAYDLWTRALAAAGAPPPDASAATALEGEAARFQLFRRVCDGLQGAALEAPVLLTLDDVHAADLSSLRLLEFVARELRGMRAALIITRRDLDPTLTPEVEATLARTAREGQVFALGRLPRADVGRLVREETPALAEELEAAIWEATQGNPLFATELVRLLQQDPERARSGEVPIPYSVRDIVRRRLAGIEVAGAPPSGPAVRELLEAASVFGPEVAEVELALTLRAPLVDLADAIELALRSGLLIRRSGQRLAFPHALMRDAIRRDVAGPRRGDLHRAAAAALERLDAGRTAVEIAHHALAAGADADLVARVSRAVEGLVAAFADDDAALLLERAIGVLEAAGEAGGAAQLRVLLGETLIRRGDLAGGRAACARAASQARSDGDAVLLARAALAHAAAATQGETDRATHALLDEALASLSHGPQALRVRVQARLAGSLQPAPDPAAAARAALDAVRAARALEDDRTLLDVLHSAGAAFGEAVFVPEVVDLWREAVRLAERLGDRAKLLRARLRLIFSLMETGDVSAADGHIDAFETDARATGQPRHRWPTPLLRSMRALQEGRFDAAEALAEEAGDLATQSRDPMARGALLAHRFARLRAQARGAELIAFEPEFLTVVSRWNDAAAYTDCMIAMIRAAAGDLETARRHLARVPPDSTPARIRAAVGGLATIAVQVGDRAWAGRLYERLLPEEGRWYTLMMGGFAVEATYARLLGGLAALLGHQAEADAHYAAALARAEEVGARPEQARILAAQAAALAARSSAAERARATPLAARARALASELGLADVLARTGPEPGAQSGPQTSPAAPAARVDTAAPLALVADGETWVLRAGPASLRLKDGRGVRYVARLIAEPEREIHALDLAGAGGEADGGDAGEPLDAAAVAAYRRRLAELEEELREAEGWHDGARATRLRSEMEFLSAELSRALGLGGRNRRVGSAAERARVAVTRRIRDLIRRVAEQSPELGRHLEATVKTGTTCSYRPL